MSIFKSIISPMQNCDEITVRFCKQLQVQVTETTLKKEIIEHPNYPSLLSVSDALRSYKVENLSLKTTVDNFESFPTPFIAQVNGLTSQYTLFAIINKVLPNNVINWYNPERKKDEHISKQDFEKVFTGYVMLAETDEKTGEQDYENKRKSEQKQIFWNGTIAISFPLLFILTSIFSVINHGIINSVLPICFGLITLIGAITGALLLLYDIDQFNPTLQKVCRAGSKSDCAAILNSGASKIWGISWSTIGFTYFFGVLLSLLLSGIVNQEAMSIVAWLNLVVVPYVFFSLYYQWKIAKQWCPMCLVIQLVLVLQFVIAFVGNFYQSLNLLEFPIFLTFSFSFAIVFMTVQLLIPALKKAKEGTLVTHELSRLKHNPDIFNAQLAKQKKITETTVGLGVTIGKSDAKYKLIKVCNPYCGPCAMAHPIIDELLDNNPDLQLQIIFTATGIEGDTRNLPVKHLLSIAKNKDSQIIKQALDDWYLPEKKDYKIFSEKYPMNEQLNQQLNISSMFEWCEKEKIKFTPTFFINGYQLPDMYSISDLKYFLSV
jgi:uncharacterized membrane protein